MTNRRSMMKCGHVAQGQDSKGNPLCFLCAGKVSGWNEHAEDFIRMHQVEIDDEVYKFIKDHAEPLVDTFNSTLRRFLPIAGTKGCITPSAREEVVRHDDENLLPTLPKRLPQALRQILEVVHLVQNGYSRPDATRYAAKHHNIAPQTIIDKYTRQINITASEFDRLIDQKDLVDLRKTLIFKYSEHNQLIDEICTPPAKN